MQTKIDDFQIINQSLRENDKIFNKEYIDEHQNYNYCISSIKLVVMMLLQIMWSQFFVYIYGSLA